MGGCCSRGGVSDCCWMLHDGWGSLVAVFAVRETVRVRGCNMAQVHGCCNLLCGWHTGLHKIGVVACKAQKVGQTPVVAVVGCSQGCCACDGFWVLKGHARLERLLLEGLLFEGC